MLSCRGARAVPRLQQQQRARGSRQGSTRTQATNIRTFIQDCAGLGETRFIVIGDGAILESVSSFSRVAFNDVAGRGTYATVSTQDKSFECHINLSKVQQVKLAKTKAKSGDYDLYATRFFNDEGKMVLSCVLHGQQGNYSEDAVAHWNSLQQKYGDDVAVVDG